MILMDFDGTLAPIRKLPDQARLSPRLRRLLRGWEREGDAIFGVVSGRSIPALRRLMRLPGLIYVGNHGLEVSGKGLRFEHPGATRAVPALRRIAAELRQALAGIPGALVESKRLSLSAHWRAVPAARVPAFHRRLRSVLGPWVRRRKVRLTRGRCVVEVRPPVAWHKGSAVEWLRRKLRVPGGDVYYFGDDRTDEDAFRSVNRMGGTSVRVGPAGRTAAAWRVRSPAGTEKFLVTLRALRWNK